MRDERRIDVMIVAHRDAGMTARLRGRPQADASLSNLAGAPAVPALWRPEAYILCIGEVDIGIRPVDMPTPEQILAEAA